MDRKSRHFLCQVYRVLCSECDPNNRANDLRFWFSASTFPGLAFCKRFPHHGALSKTCKCLFRRNHSSSWSAPTNHNFSLRVIISTPQYQPWTTVVPTTVLQRHWRRLPDRASLCDANALTQPLRACLSTPETFIVSGRRMTLTGPRTKPLGSAESGS